MPVDANVPPVTDFLAQVGGVENVLRFKEGVLTIPGEETQV